MTRWLAEIDLSASSKVQRRVVQRSSALLDDLQPARLNPAQQSARFENGETWLRLRHDTEPYLAVDVAISDGWVNVYGVVGHDKAYWVRRDGADQWLSDAIDVVRDLLRSDYVISSYRLRGRPWRDVVQSEDLSRPRAKHHLSWSSHLPLTAFATLTATRRATFSCGEAPSPAGTPDADAET